MENPKTSYLDRVRLFKKDARLFIASNATASFAFGISNVIFNLYMVDAGFGEDFLGFFLSISMFGTAAIAIIAGMYTDRRSRKMIVLFSNLMCFSMIVVQYATLDPMFLMLSQIFLGLASAFSQVAWTPYVTDLSTNKERAHLFGFSSGIGLLSVLAGNLLGGFMPGFLLSQFSFVASLFWAYRFTLWFSLIPLLFSALLVIPMTRDKSIARIPQIGFQNVRNWRFIGKYAGTISCVGLGAGMIVMFFNIFFSQEFAADSSLIGIIFGINTVVLAAGNFLAPAMSDRIGKVRTVVITEALSVPFLLMISWAPVLWLAVVAYVSRTVLMNMGGPVLNAFFMENLEKEERATAVGIVRSGDSFVRGVAANIGGLLLAAGMYREPYILVSGLYILSVILFFGFFRNHEASLQPKTLEVIIEESDEDDFEIT